MRKLLSVPHRRQIEDGYCLPACVQMVLEFWGVRRDQRDIARQLRFIQDVGTPGSRVLLLVSKDLEVIYRSGEMTDLQQAVNDGIPPIALVFAGELSYSKSAVAHAVVVVGFEGDGIIVNDPDMASANTRVNVDEFWLAWNDYGSQVCTFKASLTMSSAMAEAFRQFRSS